MARNMYGATSADLTMIAGGLTVSNEPTATGVDMILHNVSREAT